MLRDDNLAKILSGGCALGIRTLWTFSAPDQTLLFKAVQLPLQAHADRWFVAEAARGKALVQQADRYAGCTLQHTRLEDNTVGVIFDGDQNTLSTSDRINPMVVILDCPYAPAAASVIVSHNDYFRIFLEGRNIGGHIWSVEKILAEPMLVQRFDTPRFRRMPCRERYGCQSRPVQTIMQSSMFMRLRGEDDPAQLPTASARGTIDCLGLRLPPAAPQRFVDVDRCQP